MAGPADPSATIESILQDGFCEATLELDGELTQVRFTRPRNPEALASPPPADADTDHGADRLRHRLKRTLGITQGPPLPVT